MTPSLTWLSRLCWQVVMVCAAGSRLGVGIGADAAEPIVLAGPAMGTTYRVTLAAPIDGLSRGEIHRDLEAVLERIDRAASTWRDDSDVSRFNAAGAGVWVSVSADLAAILAIAQEVHTETHGVFDPTVGPLISLWQDGAQQPEGEKSEAVQAALERVGLQYVERREPPHGTRSLRKLKPQITLDLGGIGPGYAVDCLGERLCELGSKDHLVTLGGEARAWGMQAPGEPWQVVVPSTDRGQPPQVVSVAPGEAVAFSTPRVGRSPIDPRTGLPATAPLKPVMVRSTTCSRADALAVAAAINAAADLAEADLSAQR